MNAGRGGPVGMEWEQRIYAPPARQLITMTTAQNGIFSVVVPFRVSVPDARLKTKVSFLCSPSPARSVPYDITFAASINPLLWLCAADSGEEGQVLPVTNLVGTKAAPQAIPEDVNLMGFSVEYETAADWLFGEFTVNFTGGGSVSITNSRWSLGVRWQPTSGALFCESEWKRIVSMCTVDTPGAPFIYGTGG